MPGRRVRGPWPRGPRTLRDDVVFGLAEGGVYGELWDAEIEKRHWAEGEDESS